MLVTGPIGKSWEENQTLVFRARLYASDTLVLNDDNTFRDPQLVREVQQVVEHEHLAVDTAFSTHQLPTAWKDVIILVALTSTIASRVLDGSSKWAKLPCEDSYAYERRQNRSGSSLGCSSAPCIASC